MCFLSKDDDKPDNTSVHSTELNLHRLDSTESDKHKQYDKDSDVNGERQHSQVQHSSIPAKNTTDVSISPSPNCDSMVTIHKVWCFIISVIAASVLSELVKVCNN